MINILYYIDRHGDIIEVYSNTNPCCWTNRSICNTNEDLILPLFYGGLLVPLDYKEPKMISEGEIVKWYQVWQCEFTTIYISTIHYPILEFCVTKPRLYTNVPLNLIVWQFEFTTIYISTIHYPILEICVTKPRLYTNVPLNLIVWQFELTTIYISTIHYPILEICVTKPRLLV